nr:retrovirus-related Pol polyprotein from transposon TNT 1-94 [Tanacetum cinerariifolium]
MRAKPRLDTPSFDDPYNNLRVFERDVKGITASSSSNIQNVAFMSVDNTSNTNDVSTAYSVSLPSVSKSHKEGSSSYTDEFINFFFANQSSAPQLDYDDLEQINDDDIEEMDLKWQVAMISMRIKKFHKKTDRKFQFNTKDTVGFDKTKLECFNCHKMGHLLETAELKGIKTAEEEMVGTMETKEDTQNYAMMAYSSSNSSSDNESVFINKECDLEDTPVNDRYAEGMHAVPSPMTGNYMPSGPDVEIYYSKFTYGPKQTSVDESDAKTYENASCESDSSVETTTSIPAPVENAPKGNVKETGTPNHYPKVVKLDRNGHTRNGLGYAFTRKSCFVCGCFSHLIRDYDFHEKRMAKQAALTKSNNKDDPHKALKDKGIVDSRCSSNGRITGKGNKKAGSFNLKNIDPSRDLACLFAKASIDESNKWHITLGHVNFKNLNKLVKGNLVRGLPSKIFENDHTYVAFQKEKQHKASCIKGEYSNARTPQQNKVAERKNRTLIEATRTMLADSFLPTIFWAEAVNTACYVLNRVLVTKPQNKTPYELLTGRQPIISYLRPFGSHVTILNTIDHLGKFDLKSDSGFLVGYSLNSKAFRVYNLETKRVEENLHNANTNSTNLLNDVSTPISTAGPSIALNDGEPLYLDDPSMAHLEDIYASPSEGTFTDSSYDGEDVITDFNNLETTVNVSPTTTTRIRTIHPKTQIIGDPLSVVQTRSKVNKNSEAYALKIWILVDLPFRKKAIGTKWVYRNKKDKKGVIVRNKARLVAQGLRQEEVIDYDDVFAYVARIEAIRIFLAFASYMGFIVYQMDVKIAFLYGTIDEEVYVIQPLRFIDPKFPNKVYKVVKALYGLHQAPRAWYATLSTFLEKSGYRRGAIDKTFFIKQDKKDIMLVQVYMDDIIFGLTKKSWCDEFEVKQKEDGIFISQDKYVAKILKKFDFLSVKTVGTPIETHKPLVKDEEATDVDVHLYRSMIGSLMYLNASRPDIMFAVCACSRFQVTPKTSHLYAVKRIFRYLKVQPKLGLWYPKVSSFNLEAYSDSYYAGVNLDRKSTTGGCQFLDRRIISWQCKKQTIMATSTTEAEYVAAAHYCRQVLWIQN